MATSLRERLIFARSRLGLSAREMADRLMTPSLTYRLWERGARRTRMSTVLAAEMLAHRR